MRNFTIGRTGRTERFTNRRKDTMRAIVAFASSDRYARKRNSQLPQGWKKLLLLVEEQTNCTDYRLHTHMQLRLKKFFSSLYMNKCLYIHLKQQI